MGALGGGLPPQTFGVGSPIISLLHSSECSSEGVPLYEVEDKRLGENHKNK